MFDDTTTAEASRLFAVRLWRGEGGDLRGSVRDVLTGAHRSFHTWSDLTSFLNERITRPSEASQPTDGKGEKR